MATAATSRRLSTKPRSTLVCNQLYRGLETNSPSLQETQGGSAGRRVRYFTAAELVETLYRAMADNSVGKMIETLLRFDLVIVDEVGFAPLDEVGTQLLFRFVAASYERRSLGVASHFGFDQWGHFLPEQTTAASLLDRLIHHSTIVVTAGESYRMREARKKGGGAKNS